MISKADRELVRRYLGRVSLFREVSEKQRAQLVDEFSTLKASRNEVILTQDESSSDLYLILQGRVKVTLMNEDGAEYVLTDLRAGDCFGEMSVIDGRPRCATVVTVEDSTFAVLRREQLIAALKRDPSVALELLATLVRKLRQATEREERLAFLDVRQRLLQLFAEQIAEEGGKEDVGYVRVGKRTQKELAMRIGASREATSQVLRHLCSEKVVIEDDAHFLVALAACRRDRG